MYVSKRKSVRNYLATPGHADAALRPQDGVGSPESSRQRAKLIVAQATTEVAWNGSPGTPASHGEHRPIFVRCLQRTSQLKLRNRSSRSGRVLSPGSSGRVEDPSAWLVKELTTTFKVFDRDGNGKISKSELGDVLRSLGNDLNDSELYDVVARLGGSDGCINLEQFITFHTDSTSSARALSRESSSGSGHAEEVHDPEMEALKSAFAVFDIDKNGLISAEELQRVMLSLGDKHTSLDECRHMIKCVDRDGNQMVDFSEFRCLMSGSSVLSF